MASVSQKRAPRQARRSGVTAGQPMSRQQVMSRKRFQRFMAGVPVASAMAAAHSPSW